MRILKIEQRHIDKGVKFHSGRCPVALALQEEFPEKDRAIANHHCLLVANTKNDSPITCVNTLINIKRFLPNSIIENFMLNFDSGRPVSPFEFELIEL
jgi:hypothetical protein